MRLWKLAACAVLVVALGHLIFIFQAAEPGEVESYEDTPQRHVVLGADYFPILCDILIIVVILSGLRGLQKRSKPKLPDEEYNWLVMLAVRIGALAVIAVLYFIFIRSRPELKGIGRVLRGFQELTSPEGGVVFYEAEPTATEQFFVIMLSLIIVVLIVMFIVLMLRPSKPPEEPVIFAALPEYIIKRGEFRFDGGPRDVVINAYGATLDTLYKKGVEIPEHFTPWEFQKGFGNVHLRKLTQLFEKARYSTHTITHADAEEALKHYELIKEGAAGLNLPERSKDSTD